MNNNNLQQLSDKTFDGLIYLKVLLLNNNQIESIETAVFQEMTNLRTLYLNNNKLKHLSPKLFVTNINLVNLYMSQNRLNYIPDLSKNTQLKRLSVRQNPIYCDCHLRSLTGLLNQIQIEGYCTAPLDLNGVMMMSLSFKELICDELEFFSLPRDLVLNEGERGFFRCESSGSRKAEWMRDGKFLVDDGERVKLGRQGLVIERVQVEDEGFYVCVIRDDWNQGFE